MGDELEELQRILRSRPEVTSAAVGDGIERGSTKRRSVVRQIKTNKKRSVKAVRSTGGKGRSGRPKTHWRKDKNGDPIRPSSEEMVQDLQQIKREEPSIAVGLAVEKLRKKWGYQGKVRSLADLIKRTSGMTPGMILSREDAGSTGESSADGSQQVVTSALSNCALLEIDVYRYAKLAFCEETFIYLKQQGAFSDCLNTMIAIIRETERIRDADIIPLLEKAFDMQKDRNKIARDTSAKGELVLELINDLALAANTLSDRIREAAAALPVAVK
jgi:hypothetical protein